MFILVVFLLLLKRFPVQFSEFRTTFPPRRSNINKHCTRNTELTRGILDCYGNIRTWFYLLTLNYSHVLRLGSFYTIEWFSAWTFPKLVWMLPVKLDLAEPIFIWSCCQGLTSKTIITYVYFCWTRNIYFIGIWIQWPYIKAKKLSARLLTIYQFARKMMIVTNIIVKKMQKLFHYR